MSTKTRYPAAIWLGLTALLAVACMEPYVNYTPREWKYRHSKKHNPNEIEVYLQYSQPSRRYTVVGVGYVPLGLGKNSCNGTTGSRKFTVEQGIATLQKEAAERGVDAIISVEHVQEERKMPARSGIGGGPYGFGGRHTGSYTFMAQFVTAEFVIWK